jgi:glycine oxidase
VDTVRNDVVVVGAGIIGLTTAFRLLRAGHAVTLFDPSPAKGATFAAAGMIAPSAEIAPGEFSNYELQRGALAAWRELASDLEELTGEHLRIEQCGTLLVGWDASDRRLVEQFARVAHGFGVTATRTSREEWPDAFNALTPRVDEGLFLEGDAWIDPDQAVRILQDALSLLGAKIIADEVVRVGSDDALVWAWSESGEVHARYGVIASGARGLPEGLSSRHNNVVRPVRGVTIRVEGLERNELPTVRSFVRGRPFYMVNRLDGYAVLGASTDERGDSVIEAGELSRLLRDALDLVPALESATVLETRIGLRPASANLQPFFEVLGESRWAWSSGHYRHGVTLAPLAANDALHFVQGTP